MERPLVRSAEPAELLFLDDTKKLRLKLERQLCHLVEKDCARRRHFEQPELQCAGVGESACFVSEELALEQSFRYRGAVDGDEGISGARAGGVDAAREKLFTGACLADEEDGNRPARGDLGSESDRFSKRAAVADDMRVPAFVWSEGAPCRNGFPPVLRARNKSTPPNSALQ